jgi:hypothetical protein
MQGARTLNWEINVNITLGSNGTAMDSEISGPISRRAFLVSFINDTLLWFNKVLNNSTATSVSQTLLIVEPFHMLL